MSLALLGLAAFGAYATVMEELHPGWPHEERHAPRSAAGESSAAPG